MKYLKSYKIFESRSEIDDILDELRDDGLKYTIQNNNIYIPKIYNANPLIIQDIIHKLKGLMDYKVIHLGCYIYYFNQDKWSQIQNWFNSIWNDLSIINVDVYNKDGGEFIYYNSNNEWIFYQDVEKELFWCEYNRYWSIFKSKFQIDHNEIQAITKCLVEDVLKNKIVTPPNNSLIMLPGVEDALKNKIGTPHRSLFKPYKQAEDALKNAVGIPGNRSGVSGRKVEDSLKNKIGTSKNKEI